MDLWTQLWGRYHVPQNVFLVNNIFKCNQVSFSPFVSAELLAVTYIAAQSNICCKLQLLWTLFYSLVCALDKNFWWQHIAKMTVLIFLVCFKVRGFSNNFWGWGREDDEFYRRIQDHNLQVSYVFNVLWVFLDQNHNRVATYYYWVCGFDASLDPGYWILISWHRQNFNYGIICIWKLKNAMSWRQNITEWYS